MFLVFFRVKATLPCPNPVTTLSRGRESRWRGREPPLVDNVPPHGEPRCGNRVTALSRNATHVGRDNVPTGLTSTLPVLFPLPRSPYLNISNSRLPRKRLIIGLFEINFRNVFQLFRLDIGFPASIFTKEFKTIAFPVRLCGFFFLFLQTQVRHYILCII